MWLISISTNAVSRWYNLDDFTRAYLFLNYHLTFTNMVKVRFYFFVVLFFFYIKTIILDSTFLNAIVLFITSQLWKQREYIKEEFRWHWPCYLACYVKARQNEDWYRYTREQKLREVRQLDGWLYCTIRLYSAGTI